MAARMTPEQARAALATMTAADFPTEADIFTGDQLEQFVKEGRAAYRKAGRPRVNPDDETVIISFRAPKTIYSAAKSLAQKQGRDRSDLLREAVTEYVFSHGGELVSA